jgi:hypothetical protein
MVEDGDLTRTILISPGKMVIHNSGKMEKLEQVGGKC